MTAGYSGKTLEQKLGVRPGMRGCLVNAPGEIVSPWSGQILATEDDLEFVMIFSHLKADLEQEILRFRPILRSNGMIWVAWPKRQSKVATDIVEQSIRDIALPVGLVDIKVCAVSDVWSGLKLVVRRECREMRTG